MDRTGRKTNKMLSKSKVLESSEQNYQKIELEELKRGNYAQAIEHIE